MIKSGLAMLKDFRKLRSRSHIYGIPSGSINSLMRTLDKEKKYN
jgi:hypothetical protein